MACDKQAPILTPRFHPREARVKSYRVNEKTFKSDDALNREEFGDLLYSFLQSEHILADESFVVALTGGFGSGKSHFLGMWENKIREMGEPKPFVVHVNAWESDHSGEPVLAIVSAIAKQLDGRKDFDDISLEKFKSAAARVVRGAGSLIKDTLVSYVETQTGMKIDNAVAKISEDQSEHMLNRHAMALFEDFEARQQAIDDMRSALRELVGEFDAAAGLKVILVVDELDRCRPTYAIDMLEALKHLFNVRGLGVLIAVDWKQLSCTACALFGHDLDTNEYFRKFFTRKVPLPTPDVIPTKKLVLKLWQRLVDCEGLENIVRKTKAPEVEHVLEYLTAIALGLGMNKPRQMEDFMRLMSHYLLHHTDTLSRHNYRPEYFLSASLVAALCVVDPAMAQRVANNNLNPDAILQLLISITRRTNGNVNADMAFMECSIINTFVCDSNRGELESLFLALTDEETIKFRRGYGEMPSFNRGYRVPRISGIASCLLGLVSFSEF